MASNKNKYYVTTPIYYANAGPHIGSAYTTSVADMLNRFYRQRGYETFFLTGLDEHGEKVEQTAVDAGKTPQQFTDELAQVFQGTWKKLGFNYSRFIRTTEPAHKKVVSSILTKIYEKGDIYFGKYGGNYCVGCERFLTDKELVDGKCPDHKVAPSYVEEENYFFRMSKYKDALLHHLTEVQPDFIRPERYKNEILAMLREPIEDLCISRSKERLSWGIELPFDNRFVTYVWFDALINYLTGIGYPDDPRFPELWANCEHLIAKDILKPHGLFWPTMLMAAEIPLYKHLNVHGYWVTPTGKMSKSLGNVIDPHTVCDYYGNDVFRYFVFREMTFGVDGSFSFDALDKRYHADLANNLGNLVSRSLAMAHKYRSGNVPHAMVESDFEKNLRSAAEATIQGVEQLVAEVQIHRALEKLWQFIDSVNVYIDRTKPWSLAKDPANSEALDSCLYHQLESVRLIASLLEPFMPNTSQQILSYLNQPGSVVEWGALKPGTKLETGQLLFPRKDPLEQPGMKPAAEKTEATQTQADLIAYDDFAKVKLRVGQILAAEHVAKSEKLVKLAVDLGEAKPRQIVAGIAKYYPAETLVGRKVVVVSNLKPAKLMGIESQGMLLAASSSDGALELINPGAGTPIGAEVK